MYKIKEVFYAFTDTHRSKKGKKRHYVTDEEIMEAIPKCKSINDVLVSLNMAVSGYSYEKVRNIMRYMNYFLSSKIGGIMFIKFTNIYTEDGFLYATGEDMDRGTTHKVKISLKGDLFEAEPSNITSFFRQAIFHLKNKYLKHKNKLGTTCTIFFG